MGYSLAWIAFRGKTDTQVRAELGLRTTGEKTSIAESDFADVSLSNGWHVVVTQRNFFFLDDSLLKSLSQSSELVWCGVDEHVMYSMASQWKNGECLWRVDHDSEKGREHLKVTGTPPPAYQSIRDEMLTLQKNDTSTYQDFHTDYVFDVPIKLARHLTTYIHDEDVPGLDEDDNATYCVLEAIAPPAKPKSFLQRLFGK